MAHVPNAYRKSLLFEVINRNNPSVPVEAFTLTIPPESIQIEEPQRVKYTKTFGGMHVDDYGPDFLKITISGNTGGSDLKATYSSRTSKKFDGRGAFYYFRDSIMRYKNSRPSDYDNFDIVMYDLSTYASSSAILFAEENESVNEDLSEGFIVSLQTFKLSRNKDKPLWYNYTIELIVIRALGYSPASRKAPIQNPDPVSFIEALQRSLNTVRAIFGSQQNIRDQIDATVDLTSQLSSQLNAFAAQEVNIVTYPIGLAIRVSSAVQGVAETIANLDNVAIASLPISYTEYYVSLSMIQESAAIADGIVVFGKSPSAGGSEVVQTTSALSRSESAEERYQDVTLEESERFQDLLDRILGDTSYTTVYGYTLVVVDSGATLEKLAADYLGNANWGDLIAVFNNLEGNNDIQVGSTIRIPVLVQGNAILNNFIYDDNLRDVYGSDIRLDTDGGLMISSAGDLAIVEGVPNLIQALNLRLAETLGARLRLTVYGLRNQVGSSSNSSAPLSYILSNIKDTIIQDPRVARLENVRLRGRGDVLDISFDVYTIKINEVIPYSGGV